MLEFKHGAPESGRTMFEGIVSNYPKRMDIWAIYTCIPKIWSLLGDNLFIFCEIRWGTQGLEHPMHRELRVQRVKIHLSL